MTEPQLIFDRRQLERQRARALPGFGQHDFLFRELAERMLERLADIRRDFPLTLDLSPQRGQLDAIRRSLAPGLGGIRQVIEASSPAAFAGGGSRAGLGVAYDGEILPFGAGTLDLVLTCMGLHWVNDLPGLLAQVRLVLRPDGLFLAVMPGGDTLAELRQCLMEAEIAETGGASPRVAPMVDLRDAAALLQRAGFALPVADAETIEITYPDFAALLRDLRGMGEGNALVLRSRRPLPRRVIGHAAALYASRHGVEGGRISARIQAIFLAGWAPDASQQQPARRGSGEISLAGIFPPRADG